MKCFFETCSDAVNYTMDEKSFGIFYSEKRNPNPLVHIHECCEVFFCLDGGRSFLIDDKVYDISDGDLFIINQFEAHKVVPSDKSNFTRYILHIHPSFIYSNSYGDVNLADCFYSSDKMTKISLTEEEKKKMKSFFEALDVEHSYGDELYKRIGVTEILLEINRMFTEHTQSTFTNFSHKTIQLAVDYINKNFALPINIEDVAQKSFVSPTQLSRLFKRYCGTTVTKYITSKRITEAKKLLANGKSVTEAAFMCGFNDYASFIRTFKKGVGGPPGKYKGNFFSAK